jgi:hypothetical protein
MRRRNALDFMAEIGFSPGMKRGVGRQQLLLYLICSALEQGAIGHAEHQFN